MKQVIAAVVLCWCVPQLAWAECLKYHYLNSGYAGYTGYLYGFSGGKFSDGIVAKVEIEGGYNVRPNYVVYLDSYKDPSQQAQTCGFFYIGNAGVSAAIFMLPETEASAAKMAMMAYTLNQFLEGDITQTESLPRFSDGSTLNLKRR